MVGLPSVTLSPQVEAPRLDFRVQLVQTTEESLQNLPGSFSSKIGSVFSLR